MTNCCICAELQGDGKNSRWPMDRNTAPQSRIVLENAAAVVIPTLGPLVPGHCLIVPRRHVQSMGSLSACDKAGVSTIQRDLCELFAERYDRDWILFEHGAPEDQGLRPCSIGHAHWHMAPTGAVASDLMHEYEDWKPSDCMFINSSTPYLMVADSSGSWVYRPNTPIESQTLRRRLADSVGKSAEWNWKVHAGESEVLKAVATMT